MLKTEMRNPRTMHLDRMTTAEMLRPAREIRVVLVNSLASSIGVDWHHVC